MKKSMILILITVFLFTGCNYNEDADMIEFREVDLSIPDWSGELWTERGREITSENSLWSLLEQDIAARYDTVITADIILSGEPRSEYLANISENFSLMLLKYDPVSNIWIFSYRERTEHLGDMVDVAGYTIYVAIDGDTNTILRMWVA